MLYGFLHSSPLNYQGSSTSDKMDLTSLDSIELPPTVRKCLDYLYLLLSLDRPKPMLTVFAVARPIFIVIYGRIR